MYVSVCLLSFSEATKSPRVMTKEDHIKSVHSIKSVSLEWDGITAFKVCLAEIAFCTRLSNAHICDLCVFTHVFIADDTQASQYCHISLEVTNNTVRDASTI